jgi:hypothetical protein
VDITYPYYEVVAANRSHKEALFDYAQESGVLIGDAGEGFPAYRDDDDLAIGYGPGHGLLSYPAGESHAVGGPALITIIPPSQFLEMCDNHHHQ